MRRAARDLAFATALLAALATEVSAARTTTFLQALRGLDGEQFLEDEPIWICVEGAQSGPFEAVQLVGIEESGRAFRLTAGASAAEGASEFVGRFSTTPRGELQPLLGTPGLRAGRYEVRRADVDTARVLATFRVIAPRGSELSVRAGLARANRLLQGNDPERLRQAGALVTAILERYPRSSYRTVAYSAAWSLNSTFGQPGDTGAWLEEVFAHFHDSCFGVWALEQAVKSGPSEDFRLRLRRLVGIYPDTRLARAAVPAL